MLFRSKLGDGVLESLRLLVEAMASSETPASVFEHSLTVIYRVLFLLFAEARALVPIWHPLYRDRYTIDVTPARTAIDAKRPQRYTLKINLR